MQRLPPTLNYNTESADGEEKRPPHIHIYAFSEITPVSSGGKKKEYHKTNAKITTKTQQNLNMHLWSIGWGTTFVSQSWRKVCPVLPSVSPHRNCALVYF